MKDDKDVLRPLVISFIQHLSSSFHMSGTGLGAGSSSEKTGSPSPGSAGWASSLKVKGRRFYSWSFGAHAWVAGLVPSWGFSERQLIDVSLSHQ